MISKGAKTLDSSVVSLNVGPLDLAFSLTLSEVLVVDEIPVAPSVTPPPNILSRFPHLKDITFPSVDGDSVTMLIGNDFVEAHRCLESHFSSDSHKSPGTLLTPFGWMLRGSQLQDNDYKPSSGFFVRGHVWPTDTCDLEDMVLTEEGESFRMHSDTDLRDKEGLMKLLRDHQELLEFGLKYSMEDPIAYDLMVHRLVYDNGQYQLPLLWRNDAIQLPDSWGMAPKRLEGRKKRLNSNIDLKLEYSEQMNTVINSGYAEIVPEEQICGKNKTWYISPHPVFNSNKPNKLRVVYDCAAVAETKCLNDYLMKGPDLTNSLVAVLLRFRR